MTYQISLLQFAKADEVTLETFFQLVSYVEKMNYQHLKAGKTGQLLVVKQYSGGQLIRKQFVPIGYSGYTEELLAEFEVKKQSKLYRVRKGIQGFFNRLLQKGKKNNMATENKAWETSNPVKKQPTPDEERARIAATVAIKTDEKEVEAIDYAQAYQEEVVEHQQPTLAAEEPHIATENDVEAEAEAIFGKPDYRQTTASPAPVEKEISSASNQASKLLDTASLSQEKLLNHLAVAAQERSQIRQKILDNQVIIEQAERLKVENENLELEYQAQEIKFQKLQQFNALFEELREYLQ